MNIGIIGIGNMGSIIVNRLLETGFPQKNLFITDTHAENLSILPNSQHASLSEIAHQCGIIILAVKPQDFQNLARELAHTVAHDTWIVSIMAGIDSGKIRDVLGVTHIVRCMPNLPSRIGKGITVWTSQQSSLPDEITLFFSSLGDDMRVENDDLVDRATALSGSGPGYVYYLEEQFIAAGERLGFTKDQAQRLVQATFCGALSLQEEEHVSPQELRTRVTSKGGTTSAAIEVFDNHAVSSIIQQAVQRAYERAQEMKQLL
ncbi:MAG TPA: pyrroline-5-carboxylate reductase [Patescibacteria group bacterium]|nr:pyrroline-5-carboxylate reductase [Patescibacteria group bacterium]